MKRLLMATAAVIALAVAAPIATAQYTTPPPSTAPYSTPVPDDPATPQDESLANQADTTANQPASPGTPETSDNPAGMTATTPSPDMAQAMPDAQQAQTSPQPDAGIEAQTTPSPTPDSAMQAQTAPDMQADPYASAGVQTADATSGMGENVATPASLEQHARDAGMDRLPMTAQEVCMPREITLTDAGTRLSRDKRHQLINAADRASVCELQRVVINSPNGRADAARQLLIDHGVSESMIEVQDGDTAGLEVEMRFAGIATSSQQYAQMFSPTQTASYQPSASAAPSYSQSPSAPGAAAPMAPGQPSTPPPDTMAPTTPSTPADPSMQTPEPNADPMDETEDGMSPTSGEPVVAPDMLDI